MLTIIWSSYQQCPLPLRLITRRKPCPLSGSIRTITQRTRHRMNPDSNHCVISCLVGFQIAIIRLTLIHQGSPLSSTPLFAKTKMNSNLQLSMLILWFSVLLFKDFALFLDEELWHPWFVQFLLIHTYGFISPVQFVLCYKMTCKFKSTPLANTSDVTLVTPETCNEPIRHRFFPIAP